MSFSVLSAMDISPEVKHNNANHLNEGLKALFTTLKQARDQNNVRRFKDIMAEAHPCDLEPLWPQLIKLTVYSLPVNTQNPTTNNRFSLLMQDYCEENESLLHQTARKGALTLVKKQITPTTINSTNLSGETPLFAAIRDEQPEVARLLLEQGADASIPVTIGLVPLHMATTPELVDMLLKHAPGTLNTQDAYGQTPLFTALTYKKAAVAHALIDKGANVNCTNVHGQVILHGICNKDFFSAKESALLCKKILEAGAIINWQANDGRTPLHVATENKLPTLTYLLLKHGADPTLKDRWNDTPTNHIQNAWECSPQEFITLFEQPNFNELMSAKMKAKAAKSFEFHVPEPRKQQHKTKKNKKKKNTLTFAQTQEKKEAQKKLVLETKKTESKTTEAIEPIKEVPPKLQLDFAERVTNWWNTTWLEKKEAQAKASNCYNYWNFLRKRLYHRIPKETIAKIVMHGDLEPRQNKTFKDQIDTQYTIEGEMQFKYLDNPWAPGRQRQPGFYHVTCGLHNSIYHIGFKPIQQRGLQLSDFIPEQQIPLTWENKETALYSICFDPQDCVSHVLYL